MTRHTICFISSSLQHLRQHDPDNLVRFIASRHAHGTQTRRGSSPGSFGCASFPSFGPVLSAVDVLSTLVYLLYHLSCVLVEEPFGELIERTVVTILFGQLERGDEHGLIHLFQRVVLEVRFQYFASFLAVHRQHPLIEMSCGCERRLISQNLLQEGEPWHAPPQYQKAGRQGGRHYQTERPPERRPEDCRQQDSYRRG